MTTLCTSQPIYCSSSYSQRLRQKTIAIKSQEYEKAHGINVITQGCNLVSMFGKFVPTKTCIQTDCSHTKSHVYRSYKDRMNRVFGCNFVCKQVTV